MQVSDDGGNSSMRSQIQPVRLMATDRLKKEIAETLPLDEVAIRLGVELEASGTQLRGLCPLHDEHTPSFYVSPGKGQGGLFYCFGCKEGGDSIALVQKLKHLDFPDAVVWLAEQAEIDIAPYTRPITEEERQQDQLRFWCERWLDSRLLGDERVQDQDVLDRFGVGRRLQPVDIPSYMADKSWWMDGVVFPYRTPSGKLVGWKTRHSDKKMFGTPTDFPLRQTAFFGIDVALENVRGDTPLVLVEGEYDCLALHEHGITNVAAIGGSNFTNEHFELLAASRVGTVVLWMDGDEAGDVAANGVARRYWNDGRVNIKIATGWYGADPEDVVRSMGKDSALSIIDRATGALEWLLRKEFDRTDRETLTAKLDFIGWVQSEFGSQLGGLREETTLRTVASWLGLSDAEVMDFARQDKAELFAAESERVVIGKAVREPAYFQQVRKRIHVDTFFLERHKRLWGVLEKLFAEGLDQDATIVQVKAAAVGVSDEFLDAIIATGDLNIGWHEDRIIDLAVRRLAKTDVARFTDQISDLNTPATQAIGRLTHSVTDRALGNSGAFREIADQVDETMELIYERMRSPGLVAGIDLGSQFPRLTEHLNGLQSRKFVLVAAASGVGKTSFTLQLCAATAIGQAVPTDFVSLEMDHDEIVFKLAAHLSGIDSHKIAKGLLDPPEMKRVERAMLKIRNSPLRIYAPDGITPSEFVLYARESVMERRTEVFVIDYVQMTSPDPEDARLPKYQQIGNFGYAAKLKVARGLDVAVVACAQLRRDAAGKEEPTPEDMGDSYDLVRAADAVLLLSQPPDQSMELWIGKNRMGRSHVLIPMEHDGPTQTFRERSGGNHVPDWRILD